MTFQETQLKRYERMVEKFEQDIGHLKAQRDKANPQDKQAFITQIEAIAYEKANYKAAADSIKKALT